MFWYKSGLEIWANELWAVASFAFKISNWIHNQQSQQVIIKTKIFGPGISGKLIWISFWPYLTLYVHSLQTSVRFQLKKMLLFTQDTWWRQCRMFLGFSAAAIEDVVSNWLALNVMFILIIDFQLRPFSWDDLRHTSFSFHRQHTEKYKRTQQFIDTEYAPSSPSSEMFELSLFLKLVNFCFSIFYWNYF